MNLRSEIESLISNFIKSYSKEKALTTNFGEALVGFADANGEYFKNIKSITHEGHAYPTDVLKNASIVIAYYIPFTKELAELNNNKEILTDAKTGFEYTSEKWAKAYLELNTLMADMNHVLVLFVQEKGYEAALPANFTSIDKNLLMASWSQRHVACAAGLGTFGMNNMLISKKGCCGRYNSIVTSIPKNIIIPDEPMTEEQCLFKKNKSCGKCMERCPISALKPDKEDKNKVAFARSACYESCMKNDNLYPGADVCGKCVTDSACAFR